MSLSSLNSIGQSVFELESGNGNVDGQTNRQIYTNFESNLATPNPPNKKDTKVVPSKWYAEANYQVIS